MGVTWQPIGQIGGHDGSPGKPGESGPKGQDAPSILTGSVAPAASQGAPGDFFFQTDPSVGTVREVQVQVPGPRGPQGSPGRDAIGSLTVLHLASNFSVPGSTTTPVSWDTMDTGSWSSNTPTKIFATKQGWHLATAYIHWEANSANIRLLDLKKNGTTFLGGDEVIPTVSSNDPKMTAVAWFFLNVGDYVEATAYQGNIGAVNITEGQFALNCLGY